ncbi:MAG TPA: hypothetical protein VF532_06085 [Candidatus Angelobacter sp.]
MYNYHAEAHALGGRLPDPLGAIESQAAISLPISGGLTNARVGQFNFKNILSFDSAETIVEGIYDSKRKAHITRARSVIHGFKFMDMIEADRIECGLESIHPNGSKGEPSIVPKECHFENLVIAGNRGNPTIQYDALKKYQTHKELTAAFNRQPEKMRKAMLYSQVKPDAPGVFGRIGKGHGRQRKLSEVAVCSIVQDLGFTQDAQGITVYGPVVLVPGFGIIHVGECTLEQGVRRLHMLRVSLDKSVGAKLPGASWSQGSKTAKTAMTMADVYPSDGGDLTVSGATSNGTPVPHPPGG